MYNVVTRQMYANHVQNIFSFSCTTDLQQANTHTHCGHTMWYTPSDFVHTCSISTVNHTGPKMLMCVVVPATRLYITSNVAGVLRCGAAESSTDLEG